MGPTSEDLAVQGLAEKGTLQTTCEDQWGSDGPGSGQHLVAIGVHINPWGAIQHQLALQVATGP